MATSSGIFNNHLQLLLEKDSRRGFELFYEKYSSMIYGMVLKGLGNEGKASEVFQNIFTDAWIKICSNDFDVSHCLTCLLKLTRQRIAEALVKEQLENHISYDESSASVFELTLFKGCSIADSAKRLNLSHQQVLYELRDALKKIEG